MENLLKQHDATTSPDEPKFYQYSWQMVLKTLDEAKEAGSSRSSFASAAIQGLELLSPLKDVIPDEYGLNVVKGVLGLVFEVMRSVIC